MQTITYTPNQVRNKNLIVINDSFPESNILFVESPFTGRVVEFIHDPQLGEEKCMENEGWDGEERHKYYTPASDFELDVVIDFWHSPYLSGGF